MAINKRPKAAAADAAADAFIAQAPDAVAPPKLSNVRGKQIQITLTLPPDLLVRVDAAAKRLSIEKRLSISRAGYIKMSLAKSLDDL